MGKGKAICIVPLDLQVELVTGDVCSNCGCSDPNALFGAPLYPVKLQAKLAKAAGRAQSHALLEQRSV